MKYTVKPTVNFDSGEIVIETSLEHEMDAYNIKLTTEIMRTKEKVARAALIALGWTPPPEPASHSSSEPQPKGEV